MRLGLALRFGVYTMPSHSFAFQLSKKKDGGCSTDGVSRAAFNKICLEYFVSSRHAQHQVPMPCIDAVLLFKQA